MGACIECGGLDILSYPSRYHTGRSVNSPSAIVVHCFGGEIKDIFDEMNKKGLSVHFVLPQVTATELLKIMPKNFFNNVKLRYPDKAPVIQLVDTDKSAFHTGDSALEK